MRNKQGLCVIEKSLTNEYRALDRVLLIDPDKGLMNSDQGNHLVTWFAFDRHTKPPRRKSRMDLKAALIIEPNALSIETDR